MVTTKHQLIDYLLSHPANQSLDKVLEITHSKMDLFVQQLIADFHPPGCFFHFQFVFIFRSPVRFHPRREIG